MSIDIDFLSIQKHYSDSVKLCGGDRVLVKDICLDSRDIQKENAFVAYRGEQVDGRDFIASAIKQGANLIICDLVELHQDIESLCQTHHVTCYAVPHLKQRLGFLLNQFLDSPSSKMQLIAVTGTNGKTSCVQFLAQAFELLKKKSWVFGTLGIGALEQQVPTNNTTTDIISIQKKLLQALEEQAEFAFMEVSSHGLCQGRVNGLQINVAALTNLSRDHLDYHKTMEAYAEAKRQLFLFPKLDWVVINIDDAFGKQLLNDDSITAKKLSVSLNKPEKEDAQKTCVWVESYQLTTSGITADIHTPWGNAQIHLALLGVFNLYNALLVIAVLGIYVKDIQKIANVVQHIKPIKGRMQLFEATNFPRFVVDYAHTPDALEKVLTAVRHHTQGHLWCLLGCGGDRDIGKRPQMAKLAESLANKVILTDDNPRNESPQAIVDDMLTGVENKNNIIYISDRKKAIEHVACQAAPDDMVLVAGKGHEDYQIYGEQRLQHSDIDCVQSLMTRSRAC